jgi:hypothetical protein
MAVILMIKNKQEIKIVLQKGGFAGDLIASLYDPTALNNLDSNGKINLDSNRTLLQKENNLSLEDKNNLLDKFKVLSVCDTEFAFIHRKKTVFLYSSTNEMTEFFCKRFKKYYPYYFTKTSIADYIIEHNEWRNYWLKKFQNTLDVSQIFQDKFIDKIPFLNVNQAKITFFAKWKSLNRIF